MMNLKFDQGWSRWRPKSWSVFWRGRVPVVTKADLRPRHPRDTTADNLPESRRQRMATSGSTGMPFEFFWDRAASELVRGTYLHLLEWTGAEVWDARIVIASPAYFSIV